MLEAPSAFTLCFSTHPYFVKTVLQLCYALLFAFAPLASAQAETMREATVRQSYLEALGRQPAPGEVTYWSGRTDWRSKADLINFHRGFLRQNADAARGAVVASYQNVFNRAPSQGEIDYWLPQVRQGLTCAELEARHRQYLASQPAKAPEPAHDPWIGQAFQEVLGRAPNGAEWDPKNYGRGNWSSYNDLLNKVRVRMTGQGVAYVFIKPEQAVYQGHIGWGFIMDDGRYCYGSTENPMKPAANLGQGARAAWDAINIPEGQDNGYWHGFADTEQEMLADMKRAGNSRRSEARYPYGFRCSGYWHYKSTVVMRRNVNNALLAGDHCQRTGFKGIGWNCLDQTYRVLEDYGVDKNKVMPWKQTHPSPNYWFNDFGYVDPKTGATYKGNNNSGSAL